MKTNITEKDGKVIVAVQGELDTDTSLDFQQVVSPLTDRQNLAVELDADRLEYISSKAIRVLISLQQRIVANGGSLVVTRVQPAVREIFDMTGLTRSFGIE